MYYGKQVIPESDAAIAKALAGWLNLSKELSREEITKLQWQLQLIDELKYYVVEVKFLKVDGSKRTIQCTLNPELIPFDKHPITIDNDSADEISVIRVYEVDLQEFRSFRLGNVIGFSFVGNRLS